MIPTFIIFLREGIEASLIVSILLTYLDKVNARQYFRDVITGVVAALVLSAAAGTLIFITIHNYSGTLLQTTFETVTFFIASVAMTYMTFWMYQHGSQMSSILKAKTEYSLQKKKRLGMIAIAFQAVARESLEAMVFTLAVMFTGSENGVLVGGTGGIIASLLMAFFIYRMGKKINIAKLFRVVGVMLIMFSAGLLSDAVQNLQQLGWLPVLSEQVWNVSAFLSPKSSLGALAHMFLGYTDRPSAFQLFVYMAYLSVIAVFLFASSSKHGRQNTAAATHTATATQL